MVNIGNDWDQVLAPLFAGENYHKIREFLKKEYFSRTCYPDMHDIFNAFRLTPYVYPDMYAIFNALHYTSYAATKVVILGQDPYHGPGQAHGLAFSVKRGVEKPPSLVNIFKELNSDLGVQMPKDGCLEGWAKEGVLLLNSVLTVRAGQANSHKDCGWQQFTDDVIRILNEREKPIVFILWGANARSKKAFIDTKKHHVIESAHPSPLSAYNGFFGSKPFSRTNAYLVSDGEKPIDWRL